MMDPTLGTVGAGSIPAGTTRRPPNPHTVDAAYFALRTLEVVMDGQVCDRHSSAQAKARVLLPSLNVLYLCAHCEKQFGRDYQGEYHVDYEAVTV